MCWIFVCLIIRLTLILWLVVLWVGFCFVDLVNIGLAICCLILDDINSVVYCIMSSRLPICLLRLLFLSCEFGLFVILCVYLLRGCLFVWIWWFKVWLFDFGVLNLRWGVREMILVLLFLVCLLVLLLI